MTPHGWSDPFPILGWKVTHLSLRDTATFYSLLFLEHSKEKEAALGCCRSLQPSLGEGQLSEVVQAGVGWGGKHSGPRRGCLAVHLSRWELKSSYWDSGRPNRQMAKQLSRSQSCGTRRSLPRLALMFAGHPSAPGRASALRRRCRTYSGQPSRSPMLGLPLRPGLPHPAQSDRTNTSHLLLGHDRPDPDPRASEAGCSVS